MNTKEYHLLSQTFSTFSDYYSNEIPSLTKLEANVLLFHNSGDTKYLQKKLWNENKLSEGEKIYLQILENALDKIDSFNNKRIFRHEINLDANQLNKLVKDLKSCLETGELFSNKAFWNFSAEKWSGNNFIIEAITSNNSCAKKAYKLYGDTGEVEKEIIYKLNTFFRVLKIEKNLITIEEI